MKKVLNWITKAPFYRLMIANLAVMFVIASAEGTAYWVAGVTLIVDLFLLVYAKGTQKK